jgi:deoxycytidylate deaminase
MLSAGDEKLLLDDAELDAVGVEKKEFHNFENLRAHYDYIRKAFITPINFAKIRSMMRFLSSTSATLFSQARSSDLQEVQAGLIDDKMYIASNSSTGTERVNREPFFEHDKVRYKYNEKGRTDATLFYRYGRLHAEQIILEDLAKKLDNSSVPPSQAVIVGTKLPCSRCRRVLLAFSAALKKHYPSVKLYFCNQTGQRIDGSIDMLLLHTGRTDKYRDFVQTYNEALKHLLLNKAFDLPAEEKPDVKFLISGDMAPEVDDVLGTIARETSPAAAVARTTVSAAAGARVTAPTKAVKATP